MTESPVLSGQTFPVLSSQHALFLDFDGTLAPLQDDPDAVALPKDGAACLHAVAQRLNGALVLISGRDVRDLCTRTPQTLWRVGGHGHDICPPGAQPTPVAVKAPAALLQATELIIRDTKGIRIEEKGAVLAIHYRQNPEAGPDLASKLQALARQTTGYAFQHGKMIIELKPAGVDKGTALTSIMSLPLFSGRVPIMIGDDKTDEDAMQAAVALGGTGIKVGTGQTCAPYRFEDTDTVWRWLKEQTDEHA
ncbi:MAG: trehalose-phosphatase [Hyphomonadaceae bacterium]|nr:trehalose-phosphatase [Hyphomonadaceae bacterium]OUX93662.1 MAG: trehalose-phosphatase [Hyphomonas sp. TMED17]